MYFVHALDERCRHLVYEARRLARLILAENPPPRGAREHEPRPRSGHLLWFDPVRQTIAMHGGLNVTLPGFYLLADLWTFGATQPAS